MNSLSLRRPFLFLTFVSAWLGLIVLAVAFFTPENRANPYFTLNFFSYFTQQSNILVGLVCGYLLFKRSKEVGRLEKIFVLGAFIDILITFVVYQTILVHTWDPEGLAWIGDLFVHTVTPLLFIVYWLVFYQKPKLDYRTGLLWLLYPVVFLTYTLVRGPIADNFYPYPFIDASQLSADQLVLNILLLSATFIVAVLVFVPLNNMLRTK